MFRIIGLCIGFNCNTLPFKIQDACSNSNNAAHKAAFHRSLVLGLFHCTSAVRINSALRVRRDLLHLNINLSSLLSCEDDSVSNSNVASNRFGVLAYDFFPVGAPLRLGAWTATVAPASLATAGTSATTSTTTTATAIGTSSTSRNSKHAKQQHKPVVAAMRAPSASTFTHADVRKIAAIALGDLEPSLRASALGQMLDMLTSDAHLRHTVDAAWAVSTVTSALAQLTRLAPFPQADEQSSASSLSSSSVTYSADRAKAMSDADCRLLVETCRLVSFFLTHFAYLRQAVVFAASNASATGAAVPSISTSVCILLRMLLAAGQLKKSSGYITVYDALQRVADLCAQTVCKLVCCTESWPHPTKVEGIKFQFVAAGAISSSASDSASVCVPNFLTAHFLYPSSAAYSAASNEYTSTLNRGDGAYTTVGAAVSSLCSEGQVALVRVQCSAVDGADFQYPSENILQLIVVESSMPSVDR